jgi:multidrug efflux pump
MLRGYKRTLAWALNHPRLILAVLLVTVATNFYLYKVVPKGFFPQQDTGWIIGSIQADQSMSFQLMHQKLQQFTSIVERDPAVNTSSASPAVLRPRPMAASSSCHSSRCRSARYPQTW